MNETQKRCPDSSDLYQNCGSTPEMVPEYADSVAELWMNRGPICKVTQPGPAERSFAN